MSVLGAGENLLWGMQRNRSTNRIHSIISGMVRVELNFMFPGGKKQPHRLQQNFAVIVVGSGTMRNGKTVLSLWGFYDDAFKRPN